MKLKKIMPYLEDFTSIIIWVDDKKVYDGYTFDIPEDAFFLNYHLIKTKDNNESPAICPIARKTDGLYSEGEVTDFRITLTKKKVK